MPNAGDDAGKLDLSDFVGRTVNGSATPGAHLAVS